MAGVSPTLSAAAKTRFCLISFDSDWLYPTARIAQIVHALNAAGAAVSFVELSSPFGHDAFLLDMPGNEPGDRRIPGGRRMSIPDDEIDMDPARLQLDLVHADRRA